MIRNKIINIAKVLSLWLILSLVFLPLQSFRYLPGSSSKAGMAATAHPLASEAALKMLHKGGNAVDAAVAAAFAIGVVEPDGSGLGGGGGMLIYLQKENKPVYINYYQRASENVNDINFDPAKDKNTASSILVPGTVAGLTTALEKFGTLPLATVLEPAIEYAEKGFAVDETLARIILDNVGVVQKFPSTSAVFTPDGFPVVQGDTLKQPELAATLKAISLNGSKGFYEGDVAKKIVDGVVSNGGAMTLNDLKNYKADVVEPVHGRYRGYDIISAAAPQSGACVIEGLNILENENMKAMGHFSNSDKTLHFMAETCRKVYSDRSAYIGDPKFNSVPVNGIVSKAFAKERFTAIDLDAAVPKEYRKTEVGNAEKYNSADGAETTGEIEKKESQPEQKTDSYYDDDESEGKSSYDKWGNDKFDKWGKKKSKPAKGSGQKKQEADTVKSRKESDEDKIEAMLVPSVYDKEYEGGHTTHLCIADKNGNIVSLTQTLGNFFGSGLTVAGVLMNNSMSNFSTVSTLNNPAPNKQPRSSIAPTIVLKDKKPVLAIGSPGAGRIVATVIQLISNIIDYGMQPDSANYAPRFFCQKFDDYLHLESRIPESVREGLVKRGHKLKIYGDFDLFFGGAQMISVDPVTGEFIGSADPRRGGAAMGD